jgi:predicted permease
MLQDLKLAVRNLWRRPVFSLTAVLTLAIGMGVNAVAFTVVNGLLLKGTESRERPDLGRVMTTPGGDEGGNASLAEYERFVDATEGALDVAAEGRLTVAWQHEGSTQTAWVLFVSPNYFSLVDARPLAGRIAVANDPAGNPSVVIGERFWRTTLNAPSLAGLTLRLNNVDVSVAGVLPESFHGPAGIYSPDVWLPLDGHERFSTSRTLARPDSRWLFMIGRVRPGVGLPEVQARVETAVAAMAKEWPDTHRQRGARYRLFAEGNSELRALSVAASIMMGIIGLVLLLACFNVANLLLARAVERERDMGIRAAVGASTSRLMRLVVTEGVVLAMLAGGAAFVVASWTQVLVGSFAIPIEQPQFIDLGPDARVIGFIAILVVVAGVLPGLWPAVTAARVDVVRVLGTQGGSASGRPNPMRRWLVGAQIAGSTAFLALAALLAQSYGQRARVDLGLARDQLVVAEFEPASHGYDADRSERYVRALVARVRALPGVADVAIADRAPFFIGFERETPVSSGDATCERDDCPTVATGVVGPGYFRTMGIALAAGREFAPTTAANEVIINQPLAQMLWQDRAALGQTFRIGSPATPVTVVGVAGKAHRRGIDREEPTLYLPFDRAAFEGNLTLVARSAVPPETLVRPIVEAAQAVDENVSMLSAKTMNQRMAVQLWPFRTASWLFSICGALALVLATVGLAGVIIYATNRRFREFGVRVSVGATPRDLLWDVLGGSARLLVPGLIVGTVLAAILARLAQVALVGVNALDPVTCIGVVLIESVIVIAACVSPAIRAARIDPLAALRSE